jgi:thiol-disulfide isomerase/thioredoxin
MSLEIKTIQQFKRALDLNIQHRQIMVIKFYFSWCPACRSIEREYEQLAEELEEVTFLSINIEKLQDIANLLGINAGPTFIVFYGKNIIDRIEGADLRSVKKTLSLLDNSTFV